jgi:hypothetical protein
MNVIVEIILSLITATVLLVIFYIYMTWVSKQYRDYYKGKIIELPSTVPPVWVKDAWEPVWAEIQRIYIRLSINF